MKQDYDDKRLKALENMIAPRIWQIMRESIRSEQRRIWESIQALAEHSEKHGTVFTKADLRKVIFGENKEPA